MRTVVTVLQQQSRSLMLSSHRSRCAVRRQILRQSSVRVGCPGHDRLNLEGAQAPGLHTNRPYEYRILVPVRVEAENNELRYLR